MPMSTILLRLAACAGFDLFRLGSYRIKHVRQGGVRTFRSPGEVLEILVDVQENLCNPFPIARIAGGRRFGRVP